jgi:hypothetical protein
MMMDEEERVFRVYFLFIDGENAKRGSGNVFIGLKRQKKHNCR